MPISKRTALARERRVLRRLEEKVQVLEQRTNEYPPEQREFLSRFRHETLEKTRNEVRELEEAELKPPLP